VQLKPGRLRAVLQPHPDPLSRALAERPLSNLASLPLTPEVQLTTRRLAAEAEAGLPGRQLRLDCLVVDLLVGLQRAVGDQVAAPPAVGPRQRKAIEAVRRHIDAHPGKDLDLATLAALCADAVGDLLERGLVAGGEHDGGASPRERAGGDRPDAAAGAGDQGDLAGERRLRLVGGGAHGCLLHSNGR
jgi:hypothetical protein